MIRSLLNRIAKQPAKGPAGTRAYAIGDVHGCIDLMLALFQKIEEDNARRPPARTFLVLLGDLVDRGPASRLVLDHLIGNPPAFASPIYLKGNHEEVFLDVLDGGTSVVRKWLPVGGYECAESYGLSHEWLVSSLPEAIVDRLVEVVPSTHVEFLRAMADTFRFGGYLFVHAGIRPGIRLEDQSGQDLRWIRQGFLDDRSDHGAVIVHGHTIVEAPEQRANRIGIDTGAYQSGVLTALGLEEDERWFLQAKAPPAS